MTPHPVFVAPAFSLAAIIGLALPLFIVTMASQNVPGMAVLAAYGYRPNAGEGRAQPKWHRQCVYDWDRAQALPRPPRRLIRLNFGAWWPFGRSALREWMRTAYIEPAAWSARCGLSRQEEGVKQ